MIHQYFEQMSSSSESHSAECDCGQVVFELTRRNPGDILACPWCTKRYQLMPGGKLSVYSGPDPVSSPSPEPETQTKAAVLTGSDKKVLPPAIKPVQESAGTSNSKVASATKPKRTKKMNMDDAPGGVMAMVGFIVGSTAVALLALAYVLPRRPDGGRDTFWGGSIGSKAIWPECMALVLGHVLGFIVYAIFLNHMLKKKSELPASIKSTKAVPERKPPKI